MKTEEFGQEGREVILLLHGGGLSWWNYRKQAQLLRDRFHVVLPVLDGHAGSDAPFRGIGENADRVIRLIDERFGGTVLFLGGLSLGAQVAAEILSRRRDVCGHALLESVSLVPSRATELLAGPAVASSYPLVKRRWFAKLQAASLRIPEELFEDYFRDSAAISQSDMAAFLRANAAYAPGPGIRENRARLRIAVGGREQRQMIRSAELLHALRPDARLEVMDGLYHGEYSLRYPERYVRDLLDSLSSDS